MRHALVAGSRVAFLTVVLAVATAGVAVAQSGVPDLRGTWTGKSVSVRTGVARHAEAKSMGEIAFGGIDWTLTIDRQEGQRFAGKKTSALDSEVVMGVISYDKKTAYMVNEDAHFVLRLLSKTALESCYTEVNAKRRIVSCTLYKKKP